MSDVSQDIERGAEQCQLAFNELVTVAAKPVSGCNPMLALCVLCFWSRCNDRKQLMA